MSRYSETIESLTGSRSSINNALSEKLADTIDVKFSGMADEIRKIETVKMITFELELNFSGSNLIKGDEYIEFYNDSKKTKINVTDLTEPGVGSYTSKGNVSVPEGSWKVVIFNHNGSWSNAFYNNTGKYYDGGVYANRGEGSYSDNNWKTYWENPLIEINESVNKLYFHTDNEIVGGVPIDPPGVFD